MPLVSVIIPTYNRYKYLRECLKTIVSIQSDELEIVVQDNTADNTEIVEYIDSLNDKRIKYYHISEHISVMENSDEAVSHSTGRYVCMLGDDDTICSSILKAARYCEENRFDACSFVFPGFNWYDMTFEAKKKEANMFFRFEATGSAESVDAKEELRNSIKRGGGLTNRMPRLYHGLVGREGLDRIYQKVGTYFPGPSPDMANGTAVCLEAERAVFISDYLIVSGYGHESARGEGNRGQHYGKLNEKPWLPKDIVERWNPNIPDIFSAETIIAQSLTEGLAAFKANSLLKEFDYGKLYASFWWHHKDATKKLLRFCAKRPSRFLQLLHGIIAKRKERKEYFSNPSVASNFLEYQSIKTLSEAQSITEGLSAKIGDYKFIE